MSRICNKCGNTVEDNAAFCPSCGAPQEPVNNVPQQNNDVFNQPQQNYNNQQNQGFNFDDAKNSFNNAINNFSPKNADSKNLISICLGIAGLVFGIFGSLMFGLFFTVPALAMSIVSVVMAISVQKSTNNTKGTAALVIGIIAIVFGVIFFIGCAACSGYGGYGCYGCIGGSCKAQNDVNSALNSWSNWY